MTDHSRIDPWTAEKAWEGVAPYPVRPSEHYSGVHNLEREMVELAKHIANRDLDLGHFNALCARCMGIATGNALRAGYITPNDAEREIETLAATMREHVGIAKKRRDQ